MRQLCNRKILTEEKIFVQKCRSLTDRIFFYSLEKYPCANKRNSLYYREMSVWKNEENEELIMNLTTVKEIYRERDKYLDQEITVGGYIDTVLMRHFEENKEEINSLYRRDRDDLI